ncbi:chymotrypsin inhibitor-like [Diabrotica virgifera virgifera]|uniref:Chymotrypsin inhibitor-like n=1 Tax=Diabrotica virgifera virgifera TaxID=50390 RepID=A0ABM5IID1_DIAVI|nr:chymotrypsin inhibitor-like [Diabrotica virgifera virgifera]
MKTIILFAFLIFAIAHIQCEKDLCGPNEHFKECKSCCSELTCQQRTVCRPTGCVCLPGYTRKSENGPCVQRCHIKRDK